MLWTWVQLIYWLTVSSYITLFKDSSLINAMRNSIFLLAVKALNLLVSKALNFASVYPPGCNRVYFAQPNMLSF